MANQSLGPASNTTGLLNPNNQSSYTAYSSSLSPATNAQNMINNQNQQYQSFLTNLPEYQANMNNQTIDQGNQQYNSQKQSIDQNANARGLLYSGLKQGAEASAANTAANNTQTGIAQNNQNLSNYATAYGNQVAQNNIGNYQGQVNQSLQQYGYGLQQQGQNNQMLGSAFGGAASIAGPFIYSDEKLKDGVKGDDKSANEMVSKLKPKSFSYKNDPDKKRQLGILAQDLEKSKMGKSIVVETPEGKAIDIPKALAAVLAVQAVLDKRLKKVRA